MSDLPDFWSSSISRLSTTLSISGGESLPSLALRSCECPSQPHCQRGVIGDGSTYAGRESGLKVRLYAILKRQLHNSRVKEVPVICKLSRRWCVVVGYIL